MADKDKPLKLFSLKLEVRQLKMLQFWREKQHGGGAPKAEMIRRGLQMFIDDLCRRDAEAREYWAALEQDDTQRAEFAEQQRIARELEAARQAERELYEAEVKRLEALLTNAKEKLAAGKVRQATADRFIDKSGTPGDGEPA